MSADAAYTFSPRTAELLRAAREKRDRLSATERAWYAPSRGCENPAATAFLEEFGGLWLAHPSPQLVGVPADIAFGPELGQFPEKHSMHLTGSPMSRRGLQRKMRRLAARFGLTAVEVGWACDGRMRLLMDDAGAVLGFYQGWLCRVGNSGTEAIDRLCTGAPLEPVKGRLRPSAQADPDITFLDDAIEFPCPGCRARFVVPRTQIGKKAGCRRCNIFFLVPDRSIPAPGAPRPSAPAPQIWSSAAMAVGAGTTVPESTDPEFARAEQGRTRGNWTGADWHAPERRPAEVRDQAEARRVEELSRPIVTPASGSSWSNWGIGVCVFLALKAIALSASNCDSNHRTREEAAKRVDFREDVLKRLRAKSQAPGATPWETRLWEAGDRAKPPAPEPPSFESTPCPFAAELAPHRARTIAYRSQGVALPAYWFLPAKSNEPLHRAVIVVCTGENLAGELAADRAEIADMRALLDLGYAVLVPTFRGQGRNPGRFVPYLVPGEDAVAAAGVLRLRSDVVGGRIFVFGRGVNAECALMAARRAEGIRGVVALHAKGTIARLYGADIVRGVLQSSDFGTFPVPVFLQRSHRDVDLARERAAAIDPAANLWRYVPGPLTGAAESNRRGFELALKFLESDGGAGREFADALKAANQPAP